MPDGAGCPPLQRMTALELGRILHYTARRNPFFETWQWYHHPLRRAFFQQFAQRAGSAGRCTDGHTPRARGSSKCPMRNQTSSVAFRLRGAPPPGFMSTGAQRPKIGFPHFIDYRPTGSAFSVRCICSWKRLSRCSVRPIRCRLGATRSLALV